MENKRDQTIVFSLKDEEEKQMHSVLKAVYDALSEKGYDPLNQLVGYIVSEDPTYITNHKNARGLIRKIDRDELLETMLKKYLGLE